MVTERRIVAVIAAVLAIAVIAMRWPAHETIQYVLLIGILAHSSMCDLRSRVIPNADIVAAILVRAAYFAAAAALGCFSLPELTASILGGISIGALLLVFVLVVEYVTGRPGMGGGDIKLYAVAGLYVGFEQAVLVVLASCILGVVAGFVLPNKNEGDSGADDGTVLVENRLHRKMPFGPFIAVSLIGVVLIASIFG